jgi:uncharacterized membrane protein
MAEISKNRLEAFSDGVIAILITIMVLELRPPEGTSLAALAPLVPTFLSYLLSFVYLAIYWNNHHHMFYITRQINGRIMWANLHLLFWLSLFPFTTAWVGEAHGASWPTAIYGFVLMMAAIAFLILQRSIIALEGEDSLLQKALGNRRKELVSVACYALAIGLAFMAPWTSDVLYVLVALLWTVPDKRIEHFLP